MSTPPDPRDIPSRDQQNVPFSRRVKTHKRIILEALAVLCILSIAIYFILGGTVFGAANHPPQTAASATASPTSGPGATPTRPPVSQTGASLQIISVTVNHSSAKVTFKPVAGAKDYRIYDVNNPTIVKYAGMAHLEGGPFLMNADGTPVVPFRRSENGSGPEVLNIPYPQIEWNLLGDGRAHTLIVEAVNMLGPVPPGNLYNDNNGPAQAGGGTSSTNGGATGLTLGMNAGPTPDGHISINGQGASTNNPKAIAKSVKFVVQPNPGLHAIPSVSGTTQTFYDTFDDSEAANFKQTTIDPGAEAATYTLNAGTSKGWTLQYVGADVRDSYPMIMDAHFMDVLFDGGTPGTNDPLHVSFGLMAMSPDQTADFSNGKVLHLTMEVDLHQDSRRWVGFELAPANDPLVNWEEFNGPINKSDHAFFFNYFPGTCSAKIFTGPSGGADSDPNYDPIWGAAGQADNVCDTGSAYWGGNGINLDDRGRLDLFVTQTHAALFLDGKLMMESDIPGGLPFTKAKVYFTHYVYHTANDVDELSQYSPWEKYWINYYHWSDERHWDNMGFEVFPSSVAGNSSAWKKLVAPPAATAPKLAAADTGSPGNVVTVLPPMVVDLPSRNSAF